MQIKRTRSQGKAFDVCGGLRGDNDGRYTSRWGRDLLRIDEAKKNLKNSSVQKDLEGNYSSYITRYRLKKDKGSAGEHDPNSNCDRVKGQSGARWEQSGTTGETGLFSAIARGV